MSRSAILSATIDNQLKIADIETAEEAGAVLTLTRTAVQAITTAGTTIVWQSELRNYQFTWSGSNITIPATGWYAIYCAFGTSANLTGMLHRINVNGTQVTIQATISGFALNISSSHFTRHFTEADVVQITLFPSANVNVTAVAENGVSESPILHIVQLSGEVDV